MNKLKRIIITLCLVFFVTNCEVTLREEVSGQNDTAFRYHLEDRVIEGMHYSIFITSGQLSNGHRTGYGITVVNVTKDALEVEKLRKELGK